MPDWRRHETLLVMKLCYIDESGTGFKDLNSPYFLLAAVVIDASDWNHLDVGLSQLKTRMFPYMKPEDFEIKGRDIRRGDKVFRNVSWDERVGILRNIGELLKELPCHICAVSLNKSLMKDLIFSEEDAYRITFSRLLERLNEALQQICDHGLLLIDSRSDLHSSVQDRRLVDIYRNWAANRDSRFIELPWFGFSSFYSGLQLVDFCAYMLDFEQNEQFQAKKLGQEIDLIYLKKEDGRLLELLKSENFSELENFFARLGCNILKGLVKDSKSCSSLFKMIVERQHLDMYELFNRPERNRVVAEILDIFRDKFSLLHIP